MNKIKLSEVETVLKAIILKNQSSDLLSSNLINALKIEHDVVHFSLELLPDQLKDSKEIKQFVDSFITLTTNLIFKFKLNKFFLIFHLGINVYDILTVLYNIYL